MIKNQLYYCLNAFKNIGMKREFSQCLSSLGDWGDCNNFLIIHSNFMKFGDFSLNLSGINILIFFSKLELVFGVPALFHDRMLFFCMRSVEILNISFTILYDTSQYNISFAFQSRRFGKNCYWLSNNTFPIETGIINLFHYIWEIWFIHKNT